MNEARKVFSESGSRGVGWGLPLVFEDGSLLGFREVPQRGVREAGVAVRNDDGCKSESTENLVL